MARLNARLENFGERGQAWDHFWIDAAATAASINAAVALTEADDTLAAATAVLVQASAALVETADSVSAADVDLVAGAAALVEDDDLVSALDASLVTVTAALAEDADTVLAADVELVVASAGLVEDSDLVAADGHVPMSDVTADAALVEDADALSADASNPANAGSGYGGLALMYQRTFVPYSVPVYRPPAYARARLREDADGALSEATVFWPARSRAVREEEWLLRRAA